MAPIRTFVAGDWAPRPPASCDRSDRHTPGSCRTRGKTRGCWWPEYRLTSPVRQLYGMNWDDGDRPVWRNTCVQKVQLPTTGIHVQINTNLAAIYSSLAPVDGSNGLGVSGWDLLLKREVWKTHSATVSRSSFWPAFSGPYCLDFRGHWLLPVLPCFVIVDLDLSWFIIFLLMVHPDKSESELHNLSKFPPLKGTVRIAHHDLVCI